MNLKNINFFEGDKILSPSHFLASKSCMHIPLAQENKSRNQIDAPGKR